MNESSTSVERFLNKEYISEQFQSAKDLIEGTLGVKLSIIELVGLRLITKKVMPEVYRQQKDLLTNPVDSLSIMNPGQEIPARFIQEFYGIDSPNFEKFYSEYEEDAFREFFRRKQASLHYP